MYLYIYTALALYIAAFATLIAGLPAVSLVLQIAVIVLIGVILAKAYGELRALRDRHWDKVSHIWIGGEYGAAIILMVLSGVAAGVLQAFLAAQLPRILPTTSDIVTADVFTLAALGALMLGVLGLTLISFVALIYLIEVFTRDLYILRIATGTTGFKPHSATFYVVLTVVTLGFLYFYWLHLLWRWITLLKTSTQSPYS